MFTSRSEYRLSLSMRSISRFSPLQGADNADRRLTKLGYSIGACTIDRLKALENKIQGIEEGMKLLKSLELTRNECIAAGFPVSPSYPQTKLSVFTLLSNFPLTFDSIKQHFPALAQIPPTLAEQVRASCELVTLPFQLEIDCKYAVYMQLQQEELEAFRKDESLLLPVDLDYQSLPFLSNEEKDKLSRVRPTTLGAVGRIPGVRPATFLSLLRYVRRSTVIPSTE